MDSQSYCQNNTLWPGQSDCPDRFDFSLVFDESFLSLVPSSLLILTASFRIVSLKSKPRQIRGRNFLLLKLVATYMLRNGYQTRLTEIKVHSRALCRSATRSTCRMVPSAYGNNQDLYSIGCYISYQLYHMLLAFLCRTQQIIATIVDSLHLLLLYALLRRRTDAHPMAPGLLEIDLRYFHHLSRFESGHSGF
jgi:hypothetical protein